MVLLREQSSRDAALEKVLREEATNVEVQNMQHRLIYSPYLATDNAIHCW